VCVVCVCVVCVVCVCGVCGVCVCGVCVVCVCVVSPPVLTVGTADVTKCAATGLEPRSFGLRASSLVTVLTELTCKT